MKPLILLIVAAAAAWGQTPPQKLNCDNPGSVEGLFAYCELRETTAPFTGTLAVNTGGSGQIFVQSWEGGDVLIRARVVTFAPATSLAALEASMVTIDTSAGNVLGSGPASEPWRTWSLSLEIYVPGPVGLSALTHNGDISLQGLQGQPGISATTINGGITSAGMAGQISLSTINGSLSATGVMGPLQFSGVNGKVTVTGSGGDVQGSTVNGSILVAADHWTGQNFNVKTVNGSIELDLPADCAAHADLSTHLGNITTNEPAPPATRAGLGYTLSFDIGGGGSSILASLVIGNIQVKRVD